MCIYKVAIAAIASMPSYNKEKEKNQTLLKKF